jgi:predicted RNase H-like HicB family nuclease
MRFAVILEHGEDSYIIAHCPALKGCWSQGKTEEEALANIKEAIEVWLEVEGEKTISQLPAEAKIYQVAV